MLSQKGQCRIRSDFVASSLLVVVMVGRKPMSVGCSWSAWAEPMRRETPQRRSGSGVAY